MFKKITSHKLNAYRLHTIASLLIAVYAIGLLGILTPYQSQILIWAPFVLLITACLLLGHHRPFSPTFALYCLLTWLTSFMIEVIGVKTGIFFGNYYYGAILGWKLWEVPLIIGVNWLILVYAVGNMLHTLPIHNLSRSLVGSFMLVGLDILIELVASHLDFWYWYQAQIPIGNYFGWYGVSFGLLMFFYQFDFQITNQLGGCVYIVLVGFFGLLNWFLL